VIFTRGLRVCLAVEPADLRRSFEGLVLVVKNALGEDERSSQIFVFTNKRRDRIRLLYWDGSRLWLMTKRLAQSDPGGAQPEWQSPAQSAGRTH